MKIWLKIICVALLVYVTVFSFWHPMTPGAFTVTTDVLKPGINAFEFTGYNTHFASDKGSLQLYVTCDNHTYYCAEVREIKSENVVAASVLLPDSIPYNEFIFYANTSVDGTVHFTPPVTSEGFTIVHGTKEGSCEVKVVSDKHTSFGFPYQPIIIESIRNLMWHVPMWFTMFALMIASFIYALLVLMRSGENEMMEVQSKRALLHDLRSSSMAATGMVFCLLGLITGSFWARFTWGTWWINDPQLNGAMVVFIVYTSYFILRRSIPDEDKKARLSAIFNIFAFVLMVVLLMVMPRFADGLHPGKTGSPAFSKYDLDSSLRTVFYPACAGFILLGFWLYSLLFRIKKLESHHE